MFSLLEKCVWLSMPDKMRNPHTEGGHIETVSQPTAIAPLPQQWSICYPLVGKS